MNFLISLLSIAMAADLSLAGKVVSIHRNPDDNGYLVQFEGMSQKLKVPKGPTYVCLRDGLNSQEPLVFSFDSKSLKIQSCEAGSSISKN